MQVDSSNQDTVSSALDISRRPQHRVCGTNNSGGNWGDLTNISPCKGMDHILDMGGQGQVTTTLLIEATSSPSSPTFPKDLRRKWIF